MPAQRPAMTNPEQFDRTATFGPVDRDFRLRRAQSCGDSLRGRALHHFRLLTSAYWLTASTSFANPAVTIARSISDTVAGIAPAGAPAFILAQFIGMFAAVLLSRWLWRS